MKSDFLHPVTTFWDSLNARFQPNRLYPFLLTVLVLAGFLPLCYPGIPHGHDFGFHLTRILALAEGMKAGQFPVWINFHALDGLGYAPPLFYSDLYLYPTAFLVRLGVPIVTAYKLFLLTWGLLCAWCMYFCILRIGKSAFGAFCGALLYVWSSYFAVDMFNRTALAETMAFLFLPLVILGLYELIFGNPLRFLPFSFGFAGLFYAHNITFVLASLIAMLFFAFNVPRFLQDIRRIGFLILAGLVAAGLAFAGITPMLEQLFSLKFNLTGQTMVSPIAERAVPLTRLFLELPYMKLANWMPSGIGLIFVIVGLQRLRLTSRRTPPECFRDAALIAGAGCLLAATNFLPWEGMMSALASIQFPWRFYMPATAFLAVSGGLILAALCAELPERRRYWVWILLCGCGFAWSFNVAYVYAAKIHEKGMVRTFTVAHSNKFAVSGEHYFPQGFHKDDLLPRAGKLGVSGSAPEVCRLVKAPYGELNVEVENLRGSVTLEIPRLPYIGYRAELTADGKRAVLKPEFRNGRFHVTLPHGFAKGNLRIYYANTKWQKTGMTVSLLTLLCIGGVLWVLRRKHRAPEPGSR